MASISWGFTILLIIIIHTVTGHVCPPGWLDWPSGSSCYKVFRAQTLKTWRDARLSCLAYEGDLVMINSPAEQNWLQSQLRRLSVADPDTVQWWFGAITLNGASQWTWLNGTPVSAQLWQQGQPDNTNEHCAYMTNDGLNNGDCNEDMPYACERPKSISLQCDVDNGWGNYHDYCYKFFADELTWSEAHDVCDGDGGRLATVLIESIERHMTDMVNIYHRNAWIGLHSVSRGSGPIWSWTFSNLPLNGPGFWAKSANPKILTGHENSSCVEVVSPTPDLYAWNNADCSERKSFICEKPEGVCAAGWIQYQSKCYEIKTLLPLSWPQALAHCRYHGENGTLLEINTEMEQNFVNKILAELKESGVHQLWMGVSDKKGGGFSYTSGAALGSFTNWDKPPEDTPKRLDCGQIYTGDQHGKWSVTTNCLQERAYVCQLPTNVPVQAVSTPAPRLSCDSGWSLYVDQCYLFNETLLDWMDAKLTCQQLNANLGAVSDNYTQTFINDHIAGAGMWIGLNDRSTEGSFSWLDGSSTGFTNWFPVNPHNNGEQNCVAVVSDAEHTGQWKDLSCSAKFGFICQKPAMSNGQTPPPASVTPTAVVSARCGPGFEEAAQLGFCYSFQDLRLSWLDASQWCSKQGGQLASIVTIQEQYFIAGRIRSMSSFAVWVGANDRDERGGWKWTDDSPFAYFNWKPGEPNRLSKENCVNLIVSSGQWYNYRCDVRNGFVCKKSNGVGGPTSPVTTTTVQAGVTLGCPSGWTSYKNHCYLIKTSSGDRDSALLQCRQLGADLVSIADASEFNFISSQLKGFGEFWIGLDDKQTELTFRWTDASPVTFTSWSPSEPNNFENKDEDCVSMYAYGHHGWNDQLCDFRAQGYICKSTQKPGAGTTYVPGCPPGSFLYEGHCYLYIAFRRSWQDAENNCQTLGGHLAAITDKYQQAYLSSELSGKSGLYWIGLSVTNTSGSYRWTSNDSFTYTFWSRSHTGKEKNTCVAMTTDKPVGTWQNTACTDTAGSICQTKQGGYTTPIPTTTPKLITCSSGWQGYQGFCYKSFHQFGNQNKLMWSEAVSDCRSYGGDLVSFGDQEELDFVVDKLISSPFLNSEFWIGLSIRNPSEGYHWSDGSPFGYNKWEARQPDNRNKMENCVVLKIPNDKWLDVDCFVAHDWICKVKKGVTPPPTPVTPTAVSSPSCGGPDSKWKYFNGMCYYVSVSDKKTWFEADDWCKQHGAHLASIYDSKENDLILRLTTKLSYGVYWIGLNSLDLGKYKWVDMTGVSFINWAENEPNGHGGEKCVDFYNFNGAWNDDKCTDKNEFICKKVNGSYSPLPTETTTVRAGNCPKGFHGYKSKCFFLGGNTPSSILSWTDARDKCRSFGKGYEIATIGNEEEQAFIISLLAGWKHSLWIGLKDSQKHVFTWPRQTDNSRFTWQDNSRNDYFNWAKGEPSGSMMYVGSSEDCVHMYATDYHAGKWNDENCGILHGYICQVYRSTAYSTAKPTQLPSWCKQGYTLYGNSCYRLMTDAVGWFRARSACRVDGAHLTSVTDVYEENVIRVLTRDLSQPVWIGLNDAEVSGTYEWIDGWPVQYTNWAQGEPSKGIGEGCVAFLPNGKWNDTLCNQQFIPVCKISIATPPPPTTPYPGHCSDSSWFRWGDSCYYVQTSPTKSWPEAKFECERKVMGLVSIHSRAEADMVYKLVQSKHSSSFSFNKDVWTGLLKGVTSGFQWTDHTEVDFVRWDEAEPSDVNGTHHEDCVQLKFDSGHWNDLSCDTNLGFVCKTPAIGIPTTTTVLPTTRTGKSNAGSQSANTGSQSATPWPRTLKPVTGQNIPVSIPYITGRPFTQGQGPQDLNTGSIVGICVGVVLALALVAAVLIVLKRRRRFVYKSGSPSRGIDNVLYPRSTEGVNIQEPQEDITSNGYIQSSAT